MTPLACPSGKYSGSTGNTNSNACLLCTPGFICPNARTEVPTEPCPPGYYCPEGACPWPFCLNHWFALTRLGPVLGPGLDLVFGACLQVHSMDRSASEVFSRDSAGAELMVHPKYSTIRVVRRSLRGTFSITGFRCQQPHRRAAVSTTHPLSNPPSYPLLGIPRSLMFEIMRSCHRASFMCGDRLVH